MSASSGQAARRQEHTGVIQRVLGHRVPCDLAAIDVQAAVDDGGLVSPAAAEVPDGVFGSMGKLQGCKGSGDQVSLERRHESSSRRMRAANSIQVEPRSFRRRSRGLETARGEKNSWRASAEKNGERSTRAVEQEGPS